VQLNLTIDGKEQAFHLDQDKFRVLLQGMRERNNLATLGVAYAQLTSDQRVAVVVVDRYRTTCRTSHDGECQVTTMVLQHRM
jgi:hypothetical protein